MKKYKFLLLSLLLLIILIIGNKVYATDEAETKKLLYQDITISTDGSITVKEVMWLNGDYNGAKREIEFKDYSSYPFTGIYSNFSGDADIYDATEVSNIKVFDISQSNFRSIKDINNVEKEFKEVKSASKGKYGVYTVENNSYDSEVTIYCPAKKRKIFYLEYTIKDAVVVHNDVAELYWCFLENGSPETILDYQAIVHLPQEDTNVMVWSHGPATGKCSIVDYKTLSLTDTNIAPYKFETLRIMFDKKLVPQAKKTSNVNGREYIIQYENAMANPDTASEETKKIDIENQLSQIFLELKEDPYIFRYNRANELLDKLTWNDTLKQEYKETLNSMKEAVNQNWKESVEWKYDFMIEYNHISQSEINSLIKKIDEGFDEEAKAEYYAKANDLQSQLNARNLAIKQNILKAVVILYYILGIISILVLLKLFFERKCYYKKYYRDFPSEDNAYIVDYLMNKKVTTKTFLVTILNLISKKEILLERNQNIEDEFIFILPEKQKQRTMVENIVIETLFKVIGKDNKCSLNELKNYGTDSSSSNALIKAFNKFEKNVEKEIKYKEYFKQSDKFNKILKKSIIVIGSISFILGFFINGNGYISVFNYYIATMLLSFVYYQILSKDKGRTKKGRYEYSKWLAHKRFLKDFGRFQTKNLPEIILWDRYFVTATILGCSKQVLKQMKISIIDYEELEEIQSMLFQYMQYQNMRGLEHTIHSLIHTAKSHSTIGVSSSSSGGSYHSSGDGFGGGSSSGGSGGGGGGWSRF